MVGVSASAIDCWNEREIGSERARALDRRVSTSLPLFSILPVPKDHTAIPTSRAPPQSLRVDADDFDPTPVQL